MLSRRAENVTSYSYDDFRVCADDLDFRGDNSPPLSVLGSALDGLDVSVSDLTAYGSVQGMLPLREVVATLFGAPISNVLITAGGSEAIHLALMCAADPGDTVRVPRPSFPGFGELARLCGLNIEYYESVDAYSTHSDRSKRLLSLVCTPNNPLGTLTHRDSWEPMRDECLIWDVSHAQPFSDEIDEFRSGLGQHEILVFSLSKLLRLPAARVGCLIAGSPEFIRRATAVKTHMSMSTSLLSQKLAWRVLTDEAAADELRDRRASLNSSRLMIHHAVDKSPALSAAPAEAGTHLFCVPRYDCDAWELLRSIGVIGLPGVVFNTSVRGVRLCVAQPLKVVAAAVERISSL